MKTFFVFALIRNVYELQVWFGYRVANYIVLTEKHPSNFMSAHRRFIGFPISYWKKFQLNKRINIFGHDKDEHENIFWSDV